MSRYPLWLLAHLNVTGYWMKRQLYVDVVQIPKDVRILLRKRVGEDDLAKLAEEYLETGGKPIESSDTHAPSGSAPQGPDHGPTTNVAQAPPPNLAPSTSNPGSLMKPPSQSWEASMPGGTFKEPWNYGYSSQGGHWHNPLDPMSIPGSPGHGSDNKWTWNNEYLSQDDHWHNPLDPMSIPGSPGHGSDNKWTWAKAPKSNPNPNPMPSTDPDPNFDWDPLEGRGVSTTTDGDVAECTEIETDLDPKAVGRRGPRLRLEILDDYGGHTTA
ncbi:hypothetical protein BGY98DRAFT_931115 [Russula aff. rugulosa BPL654]|nr:hypothetical protein BGY98DRAFT_931115 [Russula aff. rugulosa BPL654]